MPLKYQLYLMGLTMMKPLEKVIKIFDGPSLIVTGRTYLNWSIELAALRTLPYIPARLVSVSLKRTGTFRRRAPV